MRILLTSVFLALMVSASVPALAQDVSATTATSASASADLQPLLRALQETVDAAIASKEGEKLATQLEALRIPEYQTWFLTTFGPEDGAKLASIYSQTSEKTESRLVEYFILHAARGGQITASLASGGPEQQKTEFLPQFDTAIPRARKHP